MKIKPYVEKLEKSKEFLMFMEKYPDAFMVAGFFILDFETGKNVHQIDFYVPKEKKIAAFSLDGEVKMQVFESVSGKPPLKLDMNNNIDLDALAGILKDEMHNRNISEDIRKIIAIVQNIEGKKIWNLSCVLTGMEILKSRIEDESKTVLKIEKESFLDIMKKLPISQMQVPSKGKENLKEELKKLKAIEAEIEKEKSELEKKLKEEKESNGKRGENSNLKKPKP